MDMLRNQGTTRPVPPAATPTLAEKDGYGGETDGMTAEERLAVRRRAEDEAREAKAGERKRGIFEGVVVYVNGSTHPLVSDHKLKHLLAEHGARTAIHLARRQVTHVILGRPASGGAGAGGGLAGGKLEREIRRVGGCGVKYVGVEW